MRPAARTINAFPATLHAPLTVHRTAYLHAVLVTVGPLSPDNREDVIFAAVLAYFQKLGIAKKLTKPPRWSVSRAVHDASAPNHEMYTSIQIQRNQLLTEYFDVKTFFAHDSEIAANWGMCPQCKTDSYRCVDSKTNLMFRASDGTPY